MTRVSRPAFLVGFAAATGAEVAIGLLLYTGPGFLPALTLILSVMLGALALGLWTAAPEPPSPLVDGLRRRWLLTILAYLGAAGTAAAWHVLGGLTAGPLSRGLGLALLAGLPLYATGAVLAGLAEGEGAPVPGPSAAAGAAVGIVVTGLVLVPLMLPATAFVLCMIVVSGGALLHGRALDRRPERRVIDEELSPFGSVRLEESRWGAPRRVERRILVGHVLRGGVDGEGRPLRPWEGAAIEALVPLAGPGAEGSIPGEARDSRALVVGAGAVALLAALTEAGWAVELVEADLAVRRMSLRHLDAPGALGRLAMREETPWEVLSGAGGPWDAVVVDGSAVAPNDPVPMLPAAVLDRMCAALVPGGMALLGGSSASPLVTTEGRGFLEALLARVSCGPIALYGDRGGALLVLGPGADRELPSSLGGLPRRRIEGAAPATGSGGPAAATP